MFSRKTRSLKLIKKKKNTIKNDEKIKLEKPTILFS